jgi:hypothetical protein
MIFGNHALISRALLQIHLTHARMFWLLTVQGDLSGFADLVGWFVKKNEVELRLSYTLTLFSVTAGGTHACGKTAGSALYCWGGNFSGELGDGTITANSTPVRVAGAM